MLRSSTPSSSAAAPMPANAGPAYFTPKRLQLYLCALLVLEIIICAGFRNTIRHGATDFRAYYTAGYMLRTGDAAHLYVNPIEQRIQNAVVAPAPSALPFFAPPVTALAFVPLSHLPYLWALLTFDIINLVLLALTVRILRPHLRALRAQWLPLPALLFLTFLPVGLVLGMGQLSILILMIDCLAFLLLEGECPFLAGLIFSLALMKFQTAIPAVLLFLLWRRWRFILGFLAGAAALLALSIQISGFRGLLFYAGSITHMSALAGTALQRAAGVVPRSMANLYGLFFMLAPTNHLATILTLVASVLLIAWAATRRPSFPLALLIAMLVSYHLYTYDLTLALLPLALLCNRLFAEEATTSIATPATPLSPYRRRILLCAIGAFLISPVMVEIISNNLIFLYALPLLALALCPLDWSTLSIPPAIPNDSAPAAGPAGAYTASP